MKATAPSGRNRLRWLAVAVLLFLQASLFFGEGGVLDVHRLKQAVAEQKLENQRLQARNATLQAEVDDLKNGRAAIEERARLDLGMIKEDETFYLITGKSLSGSHEKLPLHNTSKEHSAPKEQTSP